MLKECEALMFGTDLRPWNCRMLLFELRWQPAHGFADDLQIPHDRINRLLILQKPCAIQSCDVAIDTGECGRDILEEKIRVPSRHRSILVRSASRGMA